ncbi:PepSY domain-containing protein [Fodinicurvata fenggangensis]|uniref:PepSY domain-containing protein n=1 Tax=Fodinicurvata fenggangensis TaxID=1121830 RepID=UPI00047E29C5|nr:PepSY domain-containing protein [Fodinicurvata fenggangensis]
MKRKLLIATTFAAATGFLIAGVQASDDDRASNGSLSSQEEAMELSEFATMLSSQGYTIHEIEVEDGVFSVEMTDEAGAEYEGDYDVVTGEAVYGPHRDD